MATNQDESVTHLGPSDDDEVFRGHLGAGCQAPGKWLSVHGPGEALIFPPLQRSRGPLGSVGARKPHAVLAQVGRPQGQGFQLGRL